MDFRNLTKSGLLELIQSYDEYIYNGGEPWDQDRQPVGIAEYYDNEYQINR